MFLFSMPATGQFFADVLRFWLGSRRMLPTYCRLLGQSLRRRCHMVLDMAIGPCRSPRCEVVKV